ncbi:hypothetical protein [Natrinema salsiterrestre]|uniref:Uncharacterized protein n=1 Tax=Natrinema salsiterrestre TaxID=2950540 RepID=A0A9Q4L6H4_9EURY|nr:hypothetical protein [Natrinema salsiterrestre]MDF9748419.1 hypothetical protein [Natrinema salsiterrestre]
MTNRQVTFRIDTQAEFDLPEPWDVQDLRDALAEMDPEQIQELVLDGELEVWDWEATDD